MPGARVRLFITYLLGAAFASDPSGCLINWSVQVTSIDGSGAEITTTSQACYYYSIVLWLNIFLFFIMWTSLMQVLMYTTH